MLRLLPQSSYENSFATCWDQETIEGAGEKRPLILDLTEWEESKSRQLAGCLSLQFRKEVSAEGNTSELSGWGCHLRL